MQTQDEQWYFIGADDKQAGPVTLSSLRELVDSGDVQAQTQVSKGPDSWAPAATFAELGFDCLVLDTKDSFNVIGPFTRSYLARPDVMSEVAADGSLYVRRGTVGQAVEDAKSNPAAVAAEAEAEKAVAEKAAQIAAQEKAAAEEAAKKALADKAAAMAGPMEPVETTDRIIGVVEWRDGTVIDVVRQLAK